ncbi:MAG: P-II family nitrogen regulator [Verrucomicrobiales bacterium]
MKKIETITKPYRLDAIKAVLAEMGIDGMTISEVKGPRSARSPRMPGFIQSDYVPKIKIEVVAPDHRVDELVHAIIRACKGGQGDGDGRIFIEPIDQSIRIRTGESTDPPMNKKRKTS